VKLGSLSEPYAPERKRYTIKKLTGKGKGGKKKGASETGRGTGNRVNLNSYVFGGTWHTAMAGRLGEEEK